MLPKSLDGSFGDRAEWHRSTITVTPSYDYNGVVCSGPAETFTIAVNPSALMDPVVDIVLCNNEESSIITFTTSSTDGNTTYN